MRDQKRLYARRLKSAREEATAVAESAAYRDFVEMLRAKTPWRFKDGTGLETFLRGVDHHLLHFVPKLLDTMEGEARTIFEFGCGTGSAAIALLMVFPEARCRGVDIDATDVMIAEARAKLYGVGDRCRFGTIEEGAPLPEPDDQFDLCTCCSVLEYIPDADVRRFCVQEMARIVAPGGSIFMTVPNRLYPIDIHSRRLGWNYFPKLLKAKTVGSDVWEIKKLARPHAFKLYNTRFRQLLTPWTNFRLKKGIPATAGNLRM